MLADKLQMSMSGLIGRFGSKVELQLATLDQAIEIFTRGVWQPVAGKPAGRRRLVALIDSWLGFLEREVFPGGCFLTATSIEFDRRPGPVRDLVAGTMERWLARIEGEFPHRTRCRRDRGCRRAPADAAFALNALAAGASGAFQLHRDPAVFKRARRAMRALLVPPDAS